MTDFFKNNKWFFILAISIFCFLVFYIGNKERKVVVKDYISLTTTSPDNKNYFYEYEIDDALLQEKLVVDDTSQYPLGMLDIANEKIYYSSRIDGSDQVFEYDIASKGVKQLTEDFYAINAIRSRGNKLYVLAKTFSNPRISLIELDLDMGVYKILTDSNIQVVDMCYNVDNDYLYYVSYNWDEQEELHKEFQVMPEKQPVPLNSVYTVFRLDFENEVIEKMFETKLLISNFCVSLDEKTFILRVAESLFGPKRVVSYDLENNKIKEVNIENINAIEHMSFYNNGLFFTGIKNHSSSVRDLNEISSLNSLFYMDLTTNDIQEVLSFDNKYINNFVLFK